MISPRLQEEEYSEGAITVNNDDIPTDGEDDDEELINQVRELQLEAGAP
jgi:hypothetical protein